MRQLLMAVMAVLLVVLRGSADMPMLRWLDDEKARGNLTNVAMKILCEDKPLSCWGVTRSVASAPASADATDRGPRHAGRGLSRDARAVPQEPPHRLRPQHAREAEVQHLNGRTVGCKPSCRGNPCMAVCFFRMNAPKSVWDS